MTAESKTEPVQPGHMAETSSSDIFIESIQSPPDKHLVCNNTEKDESKGGASSMRDDNFHDIISSDESAILKRQIEIPETTVGVFALYRYASTTDLCIIFVSCLMAIASGITIPLMIIVFGNVQSTLQNYFHGVEIDDFTSQLDHVVLYFIYLAIAGFLATYTYTVGFIYTGEHITAKIREAYLEQILRQNIAFFDHAGTGEIVSKITADTNLIQEGISQKVGLTLAGFTTFIAAFIVGFIKYWKLTLILISIFVVVLLNMVLGSYFMMKFNDQTATAYSPGASLVDEAMSSIRNTVAFGMQSRFSQKFEKYLKNSELFGFRSKVATGLMMAGMTTTMNLGYALAFWVGGQYVVYEGLAFSKVLVTVMAIILGSFSLGNVASNAQAFTTGLVAARAIYRTIDRQSPLDSFSQSGEMLENVQGTIQLNDIRHIYPSRPEVIVLDNVTLTIPAGKTTALVGASGSGKSTIIGLIERFYSPVQGFVSLDGNDISTLNLRWLRQQVSLVSQEPVLFNTTIYENIKHGLIGSKYESQSSDTQRERIFEAAKMANADDFIRSLPEGYETDVGTRGGLLSGGQKQRIAIARAIVSDPKILLLDEATSALDTKSEGVVQEALEVASKGRTTIVVAHRLSTIMNAENIVVMSCGRIVEQGTHDKLIEQRGHYYDLVIAQDAAHQNSETSDDKDVAILKYDDLSRTPSSRAPSGVEDNKVVDTWLRSTNPSPEDNVSLRSSHGKETQYSLWDRIILIASFNKEEMHLMITGLCCSIICGGAVPVQSVLLAKSISTLSTPLNSSNLDRIKKDSDFWAAMYVMLAGVLCITYGVQGVLFAKCSERLVRRVRHSVFRSFLRQDICFFDEKQNTSGALTSFLSTKTIEVAGLSGVTLGNLLTCFTTLFAGLAVGISLGWKLGLVCASTVPILIACGFFRLWILAQFGRRSKIAYAESTSYAAEAVSAIHTVASLTRENDVLKYYRQSLKHQRQTSLVSVLKSSILFALSESLSLLILALCFWYGGTLIVTGEYSMFQYYVCFSSVIFGAQSAGTFFSHSASISKAYTAAQDLKILFERRPNIDTWSKNGKTIDKAHGHIEFRGVHFNYPTRPSYAILRGINIDIKPGQYVALVGTSGCGKSTSISLIERFYNPTNGGIFIDGVDISTLNINDYRALIALVSQEPTLYSGTIRENILLGTPDEPITDDRIIQACHNANIYDFITSLPNGFDTIVGNKGVLLSGGQKQRLAIARALIRNPKILLLDEATSALDSESEAAVQLALDEAAKGRTTIAVAHRLSTIRKADAIYVLDQGQIVEQGTYEELLKKNGYFAELVSLQRLDEGL